MHKEARFNLDYLLTFFAKPEKFFLVIALLFGLPMLIFRPAYDIPDFGAHLIKSYAVSEGKLLPQRLKNSVNPQGEAKIIGSSLPSDLFYIDKLTLPNEPGTAEKVSAHHSFSLYTKRRDPHTQEVNLQYNTTAIYNPLSYAPQALSFLVSRWLHLSLYSAVLLASLVNFLIWLILIYKSIKISPAAKWAIAYLNLLPMSLFIVPSISTDPLLFGIIFLLFAYLLKLSQQKNLTLRIVLPLIILCAVLAVFKQTYFVLSFASLILYRNFANRKEAIKILAACIIPGLLILGVWTVLSHSITDIAPWSNPSAQQSVLLHHPLGVAKDVVKTLALNANGFFWSFFGVLGLLTIPLPLWCVILLAMGLILSIGIEGRSEHALVLGPTQIYGLALAFIANTLLIFGSLWVYWTAVGDKTLEGLQGRYFIPLVAFIVPLLTIRFSQRSQTKARILMQSIIVISLLTTFYILLRFYYSGAA